jgi:hypothetical protein
VSGDGLRLHFEWRAPCGPRMEPERADDCSDSAHSSDADDEEARGSSSGDEEPRSSDDASTSTCVRHVNERAEGSITRLRHSLLAVVAAPGGSSLNEGVG